MVTGQTHVNMNSQRLLAAEDFRERFLDMLREETRTQIERVYSDDGVFFTPITMTGANDEFSFLPLSPYPQVTDGDGHILDLNTSVVDGASVSFENTIATNYYVALKHEERPKGIAINPRNGNPQYVEILQDIGFKAEPDAAVDNGNGTITLTVNSACEASVDHSGREVVVYLKIPAKNAITEGIAIEQITSVYSAPNNTITTVAALGQTTISTTASDYFVVMLGPMVRKNTDLRLVDDICFIGIVTGGGAGSPPTAFDISDQRLIDATLSTLNDVLDSFSTVRSIVVPSGGIRKSMATARAGHASCLSSNGSIYVFGGWSVYGTGLTATVEAFDPDTGIWTSKTSIPSETALGGGAPISARVYPRAVEVDGVIYLMGGDDDAGVSTKLVQKYIPATDTWATQAADLLEGVHGGCVGVINGKIYYAGGHLTGGAPFAGTNEVEEYNPGTDSWSFKANESPSRAAGYRGFAVANDRLFCFGGRQDIAGIDIGNIDAYTPATDSWESIGVFPIHLDFPRSETFNQLTCETVNNVIHGFAGMAQNETGDETNFHFMFNPLDGLFEWVKNGSYGKRSEMTSVQKDGIIYLMGGTTSHTELAADKVFDQVFAFDARSIFVAIAPGIAATTGAFAGVPTSTSWSSLNPAGESWRPTPTPISDHRCETVGDIIYLAGGQTDVSNAVDDVWRFFPQTNTWDKDWKVLPAIRNRGELLYNKSEHRLFYVMGHDGTNAKSEIYSYDFQGAWETYSTAPTARYAHSSAIQGREIYILGGYNNAGDELSTFTILSMADEAQSGPSLSSPRAGMSELFVINQDDEYGSEKGGEFLLMAFAGFTNIGTETSTALVYRPLLGSWESESSNFPSRGYVSAVRAFNVENPGYGATRIDSNNYIITAGGEVTAGTGQINTTEAYNLNRGDDPTIGNISASLSKTRLANWRGLVFCFGGTTSADKAGSVDTVQSLSVKQGLHVDTGMVTNYSETSYSIAGYRSQIQRMIGFDESNIYGQGSWEENFKAKIVKVGDGQ